ncbi:MAG: hypothetical protein GX443_07170 [Deltaproteobacteria bacterium]|nr:hypothetical protein [Deltaproteobacteria bacterium]
MFGDAAATYVLLQEACQGQEQQGAIIPSIDIPQYVNKLNEIEVEMPNT